MRMLFLMLLLGVVVWGVTTEQGRLAHIKTGAALKLYPPVLDLDIGSLNGSLTLQAVQKEFNGVPMDCRPSKSGLGDMDCYSTISLFNDMPAYSVFLFFRKERVTAVRIAVQMENQGKLEQYLEANFGKVMKISDKPGSPGDMGLVRYMLPNGLLMTSAQPTDLDELLLLWTPY